MATNQEALIAALQESLGAGYEDYSLEGLWHAYWDGEGIAAGPFNQRLLAWINSYEGTSLEDLPRLMQLYADNLGFYNWSSITAFTLGGGGTPPPEPEQDTGDQTSVGVSSDNAAFASDVTAGNMIIVAVSIKSGTEQTDEITDSLGNLYQLLVREIDTDVTVELWGAYNITGGSATVTLTYSAALNASWAAVEIANARGNNPVDFTSMATNVGAGGSSDPATVTGGTPAAANNLWVAALALGGGGTNAAIVTPTGWTEFNLSNNYTDAMAGEADTKTDASGVAQTASWDNSTTTANYAAAILAIKNANVAPQVIDGEGEIAAIASDRKSTWEMFFPVDDLSGFYQDEHGLTPCTGAGDPIGLRIDKAQMGGKTVTQYLADATNHAVDGDFSSGANWATTGTWSITGGEAVAATSTSGSVTQVAATHGVAAGQWVYVEFEITEYTSGEVRPFWGADFGTYVSGVGTYGQFLPGLTNANVGFAANNFVGKVDNFALKIVPGYHMSAYYFTSGSYDRPTLEYDIESGALCVRHYRSPASPMYHQRTPFAEWDTAQGEIWFNWKSITAAQTVVFSDNLVGSNYGFIAINGSTTTNWAGVMDDTVNTIDLYVDTSQVVTNQSAYNRDNLYDAIIGDTSWHLVRAGDADLSAISNLFWNFYSSYTYDALEKGIFMRDSESDSLKNQEVTALEEWFQGKTTPDTTNMHVSTVQAEVLSQVSANMRVTAVEVEVIYTPV